MITRTDRKKKWAGFSEYLRTDLNCRVCSHGDNGTVGTGYPLRVSSWADRDLEISRGTQIDRKKKWAGLSSQTHTHTHTQTVGF
jgi:hypothetical protein